MTDTSLTPPRASRTRQYLLLALKSVVTVGLVFWVFQTVDVGAAGQRLADAVWIWFAPVAGLVVLQALLLVVRWILIVRLAVADFSLREAFYNLMSGLFFNQVLPSGMGGDAIRVWMLTRGRPGSLRFALTAVLVDRAVGLIGLVIAAAALTPWFLRDRSGPLQPMEVLVLGSIGIVVAATLAGYLFLLTVGRPPRFNWRGQVALAHSYSVIRRAFVASRSALPIILIGVAGHLALLLAIAGVAQAFRIDVPFTAVFVLTPPAMVLAMLPLSIAGWGLRETGFVAVLALAGVSATDAALLGLTLGLLQLAQGVAGGLIWMVGDRGRARRVLPG